VAIERVGKTIGKVLRKAENEIAESLSEPAKTPPNIF